MKLHRLFPLATLLMLLSACQTLGLEKPASFNEGLVGGYATVTALADSASTLRAAGKLSDEDRDNVVSVLENMKGGLDIAREIHATDPEAGTERLRVVIASLTALQAYLLSRSAT